MQSNHDEENRLLSMGDSDYDEETGQYYYRARMYSPSQGRFLSNDPLGMVDGPNMYAYVRNSPVNARDPSGRYAKNHCIIVALGYAGLIYSGAVRFYGSNRDKKAHAYVGCEVGRVWGCGYFDVLYIASMKEIADAMGFGTPEWADIQATMWGYNNRNRGGGWGWCGPWWARYPCWKPRDSCKTIAKDVPY